MNTARTNPSRKQPGQRYSEAEKQHLLNEFHAFGGSLYAYSKQVGVNYMTLTRWLRSSPSGYPSSGQTMGFMELQIRQAHFGDAEGVCVELPSGIRLLFPCGTEPGYIGRLVRELVA